MTDVLIAEDEAAILASLEYLFSRQGWRTASVTDGGDVFDAARRMQPRALVLDVMLPKRSGFELLKALRADPATADLPVLVLTARGQQKDRETALELGANAFVTKPYANRDVVETVRGIMRPAAGAGA